LLKADVVARLNNLPEQVLATTTVDRWGQGAYNIIFDVTYDSPSGSVITNYCANYVWTFLTFPILGYILTIHKTNTVVIEL
jgi:hypothetical protein